MERINKYVMRFCFVLASLANMAIASESDPETESNPGSVFDFSMGWFAESQAEDLSQRLTIAEPYIELHTGPGRGYPVFYVAKRGEAVEIIKRKTDWFKVTVVKGDGIKAGGVKGGTAKGQSGWVKRSQLELTLAPDGRQVVITEPRYDDFTTRKWEVGVATGQFEGTAVNSMYMGYLFTKNLSTELSFSQILGDFSESRLLSASLVHQPFPYWPVSPFFTLGTGAIWVEPKTSLVKAEDRNDQTANYGLGARIYVTERYFIRLEYKDYVIFTDRNENDAGEEWKVGLSVFF